MSSGTDRRARRDANEHGANEQAASEHGASEQRHRSFCRFCSALCGIIVTTRGDEVVDVRGDPEHPLSRGYTCPKGRALGAWHHHSLRLDAPLLGRGDARRPTDWGSCLDDLAARIRAVQDAHGPDAVGMYLATASSFDAAGGRLAFRLFQALGSRSRYTAVTIDTPCRPLVSDLMSGQAGLMPCLDLDTAGLTILVGTNPVVSHGHTTSMPDPVVRLRELASAPRELWVIDPRRTETARIATRHLAPRPGTDHALFAAVVRSLLVNGGADDEYLERHADGVDRLRAAVEPWTVERAARTTGLDEQDVRDLVDAVRRHGRLAALTGTGTTMAASATATEWLVWALQVVTGSYERPGGLWFQPGFLRCFDRRTLRPSPPEPIEWPRPPSRPDLPGFFGEYPCAALADEIEAGNLRALIVIGGNPATALPDAPRVERALASLDVLAVADVVHTETTAQATHVLPCAGQLERADVPDYVDQYYGAVASQYTPAVVPVGADRKPLWWICAALGERLGHTLLPGGLTLDDASDDAVLDTFANRGRMPLDGLRAAPTAVVAEGPVRGWVHERVLPDGRWRLAPQVLVDDLARHDIDPTDTDPTPTSHGGADAPDDGTDGALVLVVRRLLRTLNSQLRDTAAPNARLDAPVLAMHPEDAARRRIADGDRVCIESATGATHADVVLDDGIRCGCVALPHGWSTARVGALTTATDRVDPLTGMVLQTGVRVRVTRVAPPAA